MKLLSTILRLSLSLFAVGSAKAHSAIAADGAVDGVFTPEAAAAAALDAEKHSLVTALVDMVAAATPNLRSIASSSVNEEEDSPPLLRGPLKGKSSANLANVNVGEVVGPGTVECVDGMETSSGQTCYEACNNGADCCGPTEADNACLKFTGTVAKDGSCMGYEACYSAGASDGTIGPISAQSCRGERACYFAGYLGSVGSISGQSCDGKQACTHTGYNGGSVGSISGQSCVDEAACSGVGESGTIGSISGQSCDGKHACAFAGYDDGSVGSISEGSCIANYACPYAGSYGGKIESITGKSCLSFQSCEKLGWANGAVGDLAGCCTTEDECRDTSDLPPSCSTTNPTSTPGCDGKNPGNTDSCCTTSNTCDVGEGDCDSSTQCKPGLNCGVNNCRRDFGWGPAAHDCCYDPGKCDGTNPGNTDSCCTTSNTCDVGEGDCDSSTQCKPGLKCGVDNCRRDFGWGPAAHDCCYDPSERLLGRV